MKYLIPCNVVFGLSGVFLKTYVTGDVVKIALSDPNSSDVGILYAILATTAAIMCTVFGYLAQKIGKEPIVFVGCLSFLFVGFIFLVQPEIEKWGWYSLISVFISQGIGRALFEGTLRASFADFFPKDTEAAFANMVLQNGLGFAASYFLSERIPWVAYEALIIVFAILAFLGYRKAISLNRLHLTFSPLV